MAKIQTNVKWEVFLDDCFYDMWAVRPVQDKAFDSPRLFHFIEEKDAIALKELLEKCHCAVPNTDKK